MSESNTIKVILWAVPRTVSTAFLKSMTFQPDTEAWMEPWRQVHIYGKEDEVRSPHLDKLMASMGGKAAVDKIPGGYDASDKTYQWIKNQLEGDFPGKKLIFVKELTAFAVGKEKFFPKGFRHTFIIRHPAKLVMSFYKFLSKHSTIPLDLELPELLKQVSVNFSRPRICQDTYELLQYIKANHDAQPFILDADDFLQDPPKMLEAYCQAVGIPYSQDMLTWEAGDEVMRKHWMISKQVILTSPFFGAHDVTWESTGFTQKDRQPLPDLSKLPPACEQFVEMELPYYEKLYAERFTL